jgi:dehydrogenase/reductase SDR family protein 4
MYSVAIVTASTEGIGLAIARKLASDGAKVMISSRKVRKIIIWSRRMSA